MTCQMKTIFPFAFSPRASTASRDVASTTSASTPSGAVPTLPPSAHRERRSGTGRRSTPLSSPRSQCGAVTGSVWTFEKPRALSAAAAHATARASPGEPARRGPAASRSSRIVSYAPSVASAALTSDSRSARMPVVRRSGTPPSGAARSAAARNAAARSGAAARFTRASRAACSRAPGGRDRPRA